MKIRTIEAADRAPLQALLQRIENFTSEEVSVALELIDGAISDPETSGYFAKVITLPDDGAERLAGYICWGPTPMTARTFDLYWIAVDASVRGKGLGRALILDLEEQLRAEGGANLRLETSSKESYGKTLQFYVDLGFEVSASLADFYAPGDALIILYKQIPAAS
jgi:ribosomal protein S18 acetylase RimI-like enzyme